MASNYSTLSEGLYILLILYSTIVGPSTKVRIGGCLTSAVI
jgi:hypothetical protein